MRLASFLFVKFTIKTSVKASLQTIKEGFTRELFLSLNPPFPPVELKQFDGCKKGDQVVLLLNFIAFKQEWISDIVEAYSTENTWYFVDKGVKLPFFLAKWTHHHGVKQESGHAVIIDDISFSTGLLLTDLIMFPVLYLQFLYRKPIYKRRFRN